MKDPMYEPGYEQWEAGWNYALITVGSLPCVYLPTIILAIVTALFLAGKKQPKIRVLQISGIGLGVFTILYAIGWAIGP